MSLSRRFHWPFKDEPAPSEPPTEPPLPEPGDADFLLRLRAMAIKGREDARLAEANRLEKLYVDQLPEIIHLMKQRACEGQDALVFAFEERDQPAYEAMAKYLCGLGLDAEVVDLAVSMPLRDRYKNRRLRVSWA